MNLPVSSIIELMEVSPTETTDVFEGKTEDYKELGVYGGHLIGQALAAGFGTVDPPKLAQSLHAYFLLPGKVDVDITYRVTRFREGKNSDVREISAFQEDTRIFSMIAAFKIAEGGDAHQPKAPEVPSAEALIARRKARGEPAMKSTISEPNKAESEFVSKSFFEFDPNRKTGVQQWVRLKHDGVLSDRQIQIALAYFSDGTLMFNAAMKHGTPFKTHKLTSLDHNVWFHRIADPTSWMIYDQKSSAAADGRGLNQGELYDADGTLILSSVQESMLRKHR